MTAQLEDEDQVREIEQKAAPERFVLDAYCRHMGGDLSPGEIKGGPVYQLRRWYEHFYVAVADVEEDMVARFEFELDTTRPVEGWQQEVAATMARRAAASTI